MRGLVAAVGILMLLTIQNVAAQACAAGTASEINGNWYCSPVTAITYSNFPGTGSYNKVTGMDASTGECTQERYTYSGSLSPLNEEVRSTPLCPRLEACDKHEGVARGLHQVCRTKNSCPCIFVGPHG